MPIEAKLSAKKPARTDLLAYIISKEELDRPPSEFEANYLESHDFKGDEGQILFAQHKLPLVLIDRRRVIGFSRKTQTGRSQTS